MAGISGSLVLRCLWRRAQLPSQQLEEMGRKLWLPSGSKKYPWIKIECDANCYGPGVHKYRALCLKQGVEFSGGPPTKEMKGANNTTKKQLKYEFAQYLCRRIRPYVPPVTQGLTPAEYHLEHKFEVMVVLAEFQDQHEEAAAIKRFIGSVTGGVGMDGEWRQRSPVVEGHIILQFSSGKYVLLYMPFLGVATHPDLLALLLNPNVEKAGVDLEQDLLRLDCVPTSIVELQKRFCEQHEGYRDDMGMKNLTKLLLKCDVDKSTPAFERRLHGHCPPQDVLDYSAMDAHLAFRLWQALRATTPLKRPTVWVR